MKEGFQRSLRNYEAAAGILFTAAENLLDQKLPLSTLETWRSTLAAMRMADYHIDGMRNSEDRIKFFHGAINFLDDKNEGFSSGNELTDQYFMRLRDSLRAYPTAKRGAYRDNGLLYMEVSEKRASTTDVRRFTYYRRLEGHVASKFFTIFLPDNVSSQKKEKCMKWFSSVGRAADCFDSFADLKDDYAEGEVSIKPSIGNRAVILAGGLRDGVFMLRNSNVRTLVGIAQATLGTWQNNSREQQPNLAKTSLFC